MMRLISNSFGKVFLKYIFYSFSSILLSDTKKRSNNFLCSIICCLGKKSSKFKGTKKGEGGGNNDRYYTKRGSSKHPSSNSDVTDQKESSSRYAHSIFGFFALGIFKPLRWNCQNHQITKILRFFSYKKLPNIGPL